MPSWESSFDSGPFRLSSSCGGKQALVMSATQLSVNLDNRCMRSFVEEYVRSFVEECVLRIGVPSLRG